MDIESHVRRRANQLASAQEEHSQPWLPDLIGHQRFLTDVCEAVAGRDRLEVMAQAITPHHRLKPGAGVREIVLVPFEADVTMSRQARDLVRLLEDIRRPVSRASPAVFEDGEWFVQPFNRQRRDGGARRLHNKAERRLKKMRPHVAVMDVRRYFGSLSYLGVIRKTAELAGIEEGDVVSALNLHARIWHHSMAVDIAGMPAGCDLSSVLGVALLSGCDDVVIDSLGPELAVRWMDDIACGVLTPASGYRLLEEIAAVGLAPLNLSQHPGKTDVIASERYVLRQEYGGFTGGQPDATEEELSRLDLDVALSAPAGRSLPRDESRPLLAAAERIGEGALAQAASRVDLLLAGNDRELVRALSGGKGENHVPGEIAQLALAAIRDRVEPGSAIDGEAGEFVLQLMGAVELTPMGKRYLRDIAGDHRRDERTRVLATWLLALHDDFPGNVLLDLQQFSPNCARGILAAAHRAGMRLSSHDWGFGALAA